MKQERFSSSTALYIIFLSMASDSKQRAIMVGGGKGSHTIHFYPDTPAGCGMQVPDGAGIPEGSPLRLGTADKLM